MKARRELVALLRATGAPEADVHGAELAFGELLGTGRGLFNISKLAREISVEARPNGASHARVVLAAYERRLDRKPALCV